jgi:hypothetical protein
MSESALVGTAAKVKETARPMATVHPLEVTFIVCFVSILPGIRFRIGVTPFKANFAPSKAVYKSLMFSVFDGF